MKNSIRLPAIIALAEPAAVPTFARMAWAWSWPTVVDLDTMRMVISKGLSAKMLTTLRPRAAQERALPLCPTGHASTPVILRGDLHDRLVDVLGVRRRELVYFLPPLSE